MNVDRGPACSGINSIEVADERARGISVGEMRNVDRGPACSRINSIEVANERARGISVGEMRNVDRGGIEPPTHGFSVRL